MSEINLLAIFAGSLTLISYSVAALLLLLRGRRTLPNNILSAAAILTALWGGTYAAYSAGFEISVELLAGMRALRDAGWFAVIFAFLRLDAGPSRLWKWLSLAAIALVVLEFTFALSDAAFDTGLGVRLNLPLMEFSTSVFGLILVENLARNLSSQRLWSLKLLIIALATIFGFDVALRIPEILGGKSITEFEGALPFLYILILPLLAVTAVRNDSLKLQLHSSRNVVFHSATILFAGVLLQGAAAAAYYLRQFGGTPAMVLTIVVGFTTFIGFIAAVSSNSMRSRFRMFINENFYSYKYDYRVEWKKFIQTLSFDPKSNGPERVLRTLTNLLDSPGGILWVKRENWQQFIPLAHWSVEDQFGPIENDDALPAGLLDSEAVYLELNAISSNPVVKLWRERFATAWLVVPVRFKKQLIAFAVLQHPRAARRLDWEDQNLISLTALELGAHLAHEHMALLLADTQQLAEFNKRVTFAVHDLKNTSGQLSLLVKNAERFGDNPEFRADMMATISHAAENLQHLIEKLQVSSAIESSSNAGAARINLSELISRATTRPTEDGVRILYEPIQQCELETLSVPVALESALAHILTNAAEASPTNGVVTLGVTRSENTLKVVVTDKGKGMSSEFVANELFRPMRTTKKAGMGVGAYQARAIAQELGGKLEVVSKVGEGTTITLALPQSAYLPRDTI